MMRRELSHYLVSQETPRGLVGRWHPLLATMRALT